MKIRYVDELSSVINRLGIKAEEICLVGSAALAANDIRENHDLDIAVPYATRERLIREHGNEIEVLSSGTINLTENIQILQNRYLELDISDERLFEDENSSYIGGFRIVDLHIEVAKKIARNYTKDKDDLKAMKKNAILNKGDWEKISKLFNINQIQREWEGVIQGTENFYIYGAGVYGRRLFELLRQCGAEGKVKAFLVTDVESNCSDIEGIPVLKIDEVNYKSEIVLVAVSKQYYDQIVQYLYQMQYTRVVNGYKYVMMEKLLCAATTIDVRELLLQQHQNGEFCRYDIIEALLKLEEAGQVKEQTRCTHEEYDKNTEILVDRDLQVIAREEIIAQALYCNEPFVKIQITSQIADAIYGYDWLKKHKGANEIVKIKERYNELCKDWCCPIKGIIWPAAMGYTEDIVQDISEKYCVTKKREIEFSDEAFEQFVRAVYNFDNVAEWKISFKHNHLKQICPHRITVLDIQIKEPRYRLKVNGATMSQAGIDLKREIRERYREKIENYVPDIIFHTADNFLQSEHIEGLLTEIE